MRKIDHEKMKEFILRPPPVNCAFPEVHVSTHMKVNWLAFDIQLLLKDYLDKGLEPRIAVEALAQATKNVCEHQGDWTDDAASDDERVEELEKSCAK